MHSLEDEFLELHAAGVIDAATAERAIALERRTIFSVYQELRTALYIGVALVVTGVGALVKDHLDHIGPLTLIFALALTGGACYVPAIWGKLRGGDRSVGADYLLLLGALIMSANLGYTETQFHWLGDHWARHLLFLAIFHALTAYLLESQLVLSVALATLAGWFGIERGSGNIDSWRFATPALGMRALLCAVVMLAWRAIDQRTNAARFREVFEHFAANLAFWGVLGWCWDVDLRIVGVIALFVLAAVAIRSALRSGAEMFAVYGVGYAAFGLSLVVERTMSLSLLGATLVLGIVLAAAASLRHIHDLIKNAPT